MELKISDTIGQALKDLGVTVVTNVPGYGASEAFHSYAQISAKRATISFNEEVAFSIAHGASLVGKRSAVMIKSQGLTKAGNAAVDSLYTSITAGFVVFIFEDLSGKHSDNILEIAPILRGMSFPFKKARIENLYEDIISCYRESEQRKLPYALLINADKIDKVISVKLKNNLSKSFEFKRNLPAQVVHPMLADYQYKVFMAKKTMLDFNSIRQPDIPNYPKDFPTRYREGGQKYVKLFESVKTLKGDIVTGDTSVSSCFAFPPYNCIDLVTHLGGSIPLAIGAFKAGFKDVWAITGDFGFLSAGHMGLIEILERNLPLKVIILYNKEASATGGQTIHKRIMMRVLAGYENFIKHISNPQDPFEINEVLQEAKEADEFRLIIADY